MKKGGINFNYVISVYVLVIIVITVIIGYNLWLSGSTLFSLSLIPLLAGLMFESLRISPSLKSGLKYYAIAYIISLISFLPDKHERGYNFENHAEKWPYVFILVFLIVFITANKKRVTAHLTEGTSLLLSLSIIYWYFDYGFSTDGFFGKLIIFALLLSAAFSIINAFAYFELSKSNRLALSVWSSVVISAFSIDNIIRVYSNQNIEDSQYFSDAFYIGLQFFLLGVSAVYMAQNFNLLLRFLPNKSEKYSVTLKENVNDHLARYSEEQAGVYHSALCVVSVGGVYFLNYTFHILPRHTMIWLALFLFPLIMHFVAKKKRVENVSGSPLEM